MDLFLSSWPGFWKIATVCLCLFSWLPSILYQQTFNLGPSASFNIWWPCQPHPHLFYGLLLETVLVPLFSTLVDRGSAMYSGNTSKKAKRQQFSAWISLWLNPLIILGVPGRAGVRWRGMFYPLITPTFTLPASLVVLLLVALLLYSLESRWDWSYFMLRLPGPQFENSSVSVFTHSCHIAGSVVEFCRLLFVFCEGILWGLLHFVTNRSGKDN